MSGRDKTILVIGATGQQGGATARALRNDGWRVRALVRDTASEAARNLAGLGVELTPGDLRDETSLKQSVEGAYGVFSMQPSSGQPQYGVTDADEERFGRFIADAAKAAGVQHFVYTSVAGTGPDAGVGHFESKWRIEEHVRGLGVDATVVRPTAFMDTLPQLAQGLEAGSFVFFSKPEQRIQLVATEDIGALVAHVFADRPRFAGKTFDLASDSLTGPEIADKIGYAVGRPIAYAQFPPDLLAQNPLLNRLVELVEAGPAAGRADLDGLRQLHPGLLTFDAWLKRTGKSLFQQVLGAGAPTAAT